ncbi:hypothetical protein Q5752_006880 [Cryptotrichosporon argae]
MRMAFFRRRRSHESVLDVPFDEYDPKTRLPLSMRVGDSTIGPLVSIQQVIDHLTILAAFAALRKSSTDFARRVERAAYDYEAWAQTIVPRRRGAVGPLAADELPTLEVLMCWHAHMLNPRQYERDCESGYMFLRPLGAFPIRAAAEAIRRNALPLDLEYYEDALRPTLSITGWTPPDVAAAVLRQARFVSDMGRIEWLADMWKDVRPLQRGIVRYHAWLDLMAAHGCQHFLVPTLDLDLAWHTHQLLGPRYRTDTERLLGRFLDHNDSAGEGKLFDGLKKTGALWKERFGYEY